MVFGKSHRGCEQFNSSWQILSDWIRRVCELTSSGLSADGPRVLSLGFGWITQGLRWCSVRQSLVSCTLWGPLCIQPSVLSSVCCCEAPLEFDAASAGFIYQPRDEECFMFFSLSSGSRSFKCCLWKSNQITTSPLLKVTDSLLYHNLLICAAELVDLLAASSSVSAQQDTHMGLELPGPRHLGLVVSCVTLKIHKWVRSIPSKPSSATEKNLNSFLNVNFSCKSFKKLENVDDLDEKKLFYF